MSNDWRRNNPPLYDLAKLSSIAIRTTMYSIKEFPLSLRKELRIPSDPFDGDDQCMAYLADLGVIHYRDERQQAGMLVPHVLDYSEESGFPAFRYQVYLKGKRGGDNIEPAEWLFKSGYSAVLLAKEKAYRKTTYGDLMAWEMWSKPVTILELSPSIVRCA